MYKERVEAAAKDMEGERRFDATSQLHCDVRQQDCPRRASLQIGWHRLLSKPLVTVVTMWLRNALSNTLSLTVLCLIRVVPGDPVHPDPDGGLHAAAFLRL